MRRARVIVPIAAVAFFFFGGWALRNKLAADRQGDWIEATRGDVVTGVDVSGTLAAIDSSVLGPPQIPDTWEFKVSMMAPEGADVKKGAPVLGFDTSELQRRLDQYRALAEQAAKEIEKKRSDLALHRESDRIALAEAEAKLRKTALKLEAPADIVGIKEREEVQLDYETSKREVTSIRDRLAAFERAAAAQIRLLESKRAQAEAVVHDSEASIKAMMVTAPRDGTVVYMTDWKRRQEEGRRQLLARPACRRDPRPEQDEGEGRSGRGRCRQDRGRPARHASASTRIPTTSCTARSRRPRARSSSRAGRRIR